MVALFKTPLFFVSSLVVLSSFGEVAARDHLPRHPAHSAPKTCPKPSTIHPKNTKCCVWYQIQHDLLTKVFQYSCKDNARAAIRLSFHDAIAFSSALKKEGKWAGGGADGSLIKFPSELNRSENAFLSTIVGVLKPIADKYHVSYGDIIQFAAAVALTQCPGGPRIHFWSGRPAATQAPPQHLLPGPGDSPQTLINRFADAGLRAWELVALTGAHTVAGVDVDINGDGKEDDDAPFDTSEKTFDTQFYVDTLQHKVPAGTVQIASDRALARSPSTACTFQNYVNNQTKFDNDFAESMLKLSLIGHSSSEISHFVDCSEAVPAKKKLTRKVKFPPLKNWDLSCHKDGKLVQPHIPH